MASEEAVEFRYLGMSDRPLIDPGKLTDSHSSGYPLPFASRLELNPCFPHILMLTHNSPDLHF